MSDTTRLYYLGGGLEREHANGKRYLVVTSRNTPFIVDVEKGFIDIRAYFARDLMRRYNIPGKEIFSLNQNLQTQIESAPIKQELTREELVAMLAEMDGDSDKKAPRRSNKASEEKGGE